MLNALANFHRYSEYTMYHLYVDFFQCTKKGDTMLKHFVRFLHHNGTTSELEIESRLASFTIPDNTTAYCYVDKEYEMQENGKLSYKYDCNLSATTYTAGKVVCMAELKGFYYQMHKAAQQHATPLTVIGWQLFTLDDLAKLISKMEKRSCDKIIFTPRKGIFVFSPNDCVL